jgi:hypothetical protein
MHKTRVPTLQGAASSRTYKSAFHDGTLLYAKCIHANFATKEAGQTGVRFGMCARLGDPAEERPSLQ